MRPGRANAASGGNRIVRPCHPCPIAIRTGHAPCRRPRTGTAFPFYPRPHHTQRHVRPHTTRGLTCGSGAAGPAHHVLASDRLLCVVHRRYVTAGLSARAVRAGTTRERRSSIGVYHTRAYRSRTTTFSPRVSLVQTTHLSHIHDLDTLSVKFMWLYIWEVYFYIIVWPCNDIFISCIYVV